MPLLKSLEILNLLLELAGNGLITITLRLDQIRAISMELLFNGCHENA